MPTHVTESTGASPTATWEFTTGQLDISTAATMRVGTIGERTSGGGVTIDGVLLKDGYAQLGTGASLAVACGGTGATTAANARTALGTAGSGANSDITSITGLTTPLTVAQGGTGAATLTGLVQGNGVGACTGVAADQYALVYATAANTFGALSKGTSGFGLVCTDTGYEWREAGTTLVTSQLIPAGAKMLFYANSAPTGWTIDSSVNDKLVYVTDNTAVSGAAALATGTWTQPDHVHSGPSHTHTGPSHTHGLSTHTHSVTLPTSGWTQVGPVAGRLVWSTASDPTMDARTLTSGGGSANTAAAGTGATGAGGTGTTGTSATASSWRPASYCFILCTKD